MGIEIQGQIQLGVFYIALKLFWRYTKSVLLKKLSVKKKKRLPLSTSIQKSTDLEVH